MKTIETTIYECEFCGKYYKRKHFAIRHEDLCYLNPENQPKCYGCKYLEKVDVKLNVEVELLGTDYGICYGEKEKQYSLLKCIKKDVFIIPIISYKKGKCFEPNLLDEIEMIVAPLECEDYENEYFEF